jgi:PAS domain S-box-containing protein
MSLAILPLLSISALSALIGYYVLRKNPRNAANKSFAFFASTLVAWTVWVSAAHYIPDHSTFSVRAAFAAASVMIFALFLLFRSFPDQTILRWDWTIRLFFSAGLLLSALSFTPFIVSKASLESSGLQAHYGPLHPLYGAYIYAGFVTSILFLVKKYRLSSGLVRLQLNYLLLGLLVPGLGVTITNLLVPLISGSPRTGQYGPYLAVVFLAFTAHALIHYRFMDIRLVLRRGVTLVLALLGSVFILVAGSVLVWALFPFDIQRSHVILLVTASIVISSLLPVLRNLLSTLLDRYVYRQDIDFPRTLHDTSQALVAILDLDALSAYTTHATVRALRSETAALYLSDGGSFRLYSQHKEGIALPRTNPCPLSVPSTFPIVAFLSNRKEPLVAEEVPQRFPNHTHQLLLTTLTSLRWGLVLPVRTNDILQGFLAVGPKLSGDPFFPNELELMEILSNQVGIAVRNAELYKQIVLANGYIENILGTMESGVVAINPQRHITLCNKAAERMIGVSVDLLREKGAEQLPHALWRPLADTLVDGHGRIQFESTLVNSAGSVTPIVCSTSPLRDDLGIILGALIVFNDLTKLKDLEREKRRSERLSAFGAIASGIAHEIKNPLVAIRTFAELLPERFADVDFREDFSRVVITEIDRIDDLVDRLRGIAASTPSRQVGKIDVRKPIADTLSLLRGRLEQTHTTVHSDVLDPEPFVGVEDAQLKQLFLNLFLNAIEAMGSGGTLTVRILRNKKVDSSRVTIEISDTGPGIPESIKGNIFDPFFTTKTRGSGLGLAICRSIVDAHQGSIRAENNSQGLGTTIVVDLPSTSAPSPGLGLDALQRSAEHLPLR